MTTSPAGSYRRGVDRGALAVFTVFTTFMVFTPVTLAQDVPALTGPVNDLAHVIDPSSAAELDRQIRALQAASGDAVTVLTVESYEPFGSIDAFAVKVFERTGVGAKGQDNGLLVVLAVKERRVRIEVGYGLEEFITDGFSGDAIRQVMLPEFRQARYGQGLLAGTSRVIQRIADRRGVTLAGVRQDRPQESSRPSIPLFVITLIVLILIVSRIRRSGGPPSFGRRRWPGQGWSGWYGGPGGFGGRGFGGGFGGGGGGGGFGGFGGGRSGGGGASGGW